MSTRPGMRVAFAGTPEFAAVALQRIHAAGFRIVSNADLKNVHYGDPDTLRAVFNGELWRGRDNLRVSLKALTLRGLPSVLIPIGDVGLLALAIVTGAGAALWIARSVTQGLSRAGGAV